MSDNIVAQNEPKHKSYQEMELQLSAATDLLRQRDTEIARLHNAAIAASNELDAFRRGAELVDAASQSDRLYLEAEIARLRDQRDEAESQAASLARQVSDIEDRRDASDAAELDALRTENAILERQLSDMTHGVNTLINQRDAAIKRAENAENAAAALANTIHARSQS